MGHPAAADSHPSRSGPALPRVLFVSSHALPGGSERVLADLLECLPAGAVAGVASLQQGPLVEQLLKAGRPVEVIEVGASPAALPMAALRLRRLVRRLAPDVIHANGIKAATVAVLAATRTPVVWMKHDVYRDGGLSRLLARRCAAVPCVSEEVARDVVESGRTSIVPPGVCPDRARARGDATALRDRLGVTGPAVAVIGRLDPAKGHAELLEALPQLRRAVPDVVALLVGGDDPHHPGHRGVLRRRAQELGVQDVVLLPGHVPAPAVLVASAAVAVPTVPTRDGRGREGFGLVAAEALALGVPVVAYDVGATAEVLAGCGLLVPPGDRATLASRLVEALTDAALRDRLDRCSRGRADQLTIQRTAERMLAIYRRVAP